MEQPYQYNDLPLLKRFINEQFDIPGLIQAGVLKKEQRRDYVAIAHWLSEYFGLSNIFEYGAIEVSCHLTMNSGAEMIVIKSIYE
jgi:hypothetical protein